jgi:hypothetical protein
VCGTRGGLADARGGLRTGGLILGTALLVLLAVWACVRFPGARQRVPARPPGNRKRRKPARRGS